MLSFRLFQSYRILRDQVQATQSDNSNPRHTAPSQSKPGREDIEMTTFRISYTEFQADDNDQCKIATPNTEGNNYGPGKPGNELEQPTCKEWLEYHCSNVVSPCHRNTQLHGCQLNEGFPENTQNKMMPEGNCNEESFDCNRNDAKHAYKCKKMPECNNNDSLCCNRKTEELDCSNDDLNYYDLQKDFPGNHYANSMLNQVYKQLCTVYY